MPCLERTAQVRWFRIVKPPHILVLHMRRLGFGPYGPVKSNARARYPMALPISLAAEERPQGGSKTTGRDLAAPEDAESQKSPSCVAKNGVRTCCFALRAVVSHLGTASSGHFLAHRRWADSSDPIPVEARPSSPDVWLQSPQLPPFGARWLLCLGTVTLCMPRRHWGRDRGHNFPLLATAFASSSTPHWLATLYRRHPGPLWVRADDDRVGPSSAREALLFPSAYILVYERNGGGLS